MATTLTPTEVEPRRGYELPAYDLPGRGTGSLPPAAPPPEKHTGGNGDDDDDFETAVAGRRGPRDRLRTARVGTASALFGVFLIFAALVSMFVVTKSSYHVDAYNRVINSWLRTPPPNILWLNTAVIFLSSVAAELGRRAMFHEKSIMDEWFGLGRPTSRRAGIWLFVTLALGMLFLVGQWVAWLQLRADHAPYASSSSAKLFYIITAAHAIHLFIGVSTVIAALAVLRSSRQFATRQIWVDSTVWYWHAMGVLWVGLFILLEFFQ